MLPQPPWMIMRGLMGWDFSEGIVEVERAIGVGFEGGMAT
jgi:hypothetical protein